ncbi:SDR family NAD(P)-dependent oxidoreductase [Streptomyces sp. ISL-99]|uniref:SDR family NAD(P)-dependent oxidoreductase n=1 Tax=Streptomyces sp. ISL-99 TaxID=2819193 RepID=UPI001BEA3B6A|nr:SDR family NAD(P)-dependent oxidoreductase [Streptomyces sp. ISL-99]
MNRPVRQVVVITGASSGIGRGTAQAFAARGADVVLAARSEQALTEVARECECYRHAANYVGRQIRPLPPVTSPERVVSAVLRAADRPRREIVVGQTHRIGAWVHRLAPRLYDRLIGPVVNTCALRDIPVPSHDGTVFAPDSPTHTVDDGWRRHDHRLIGKALVATAGATVLAAAARAINRRRGQTDVHHHLRHCDSTRGAVRAKGSEASP